MKRIWWKVGEGWNEEELWKVGEERSRKWKQGEYRRKRKKWKREMCKGLGGVEGRELRKRVENV